MEEFTTDYDGGLMPAPLRLVTRNWEWVEKTLLPELRDRRQTTTTILGDELGYTGRQILNYVKGLQLLGRVQYIRERRVWRAV